MTAVLRMSEAQWQKRVTDYAAWKGWAWIHVRPARKKDDEWRTPVSGPLGKGWPDLLLVRRDRVVALELKSDRGKPSPEQERVLAVLSGAVQAMVARPRDWDHIQEVLA